MLNFLFYIMELEYPFIAEFFEQIVGFYWAVATLFVSEGIICKEIMQYVDI